MYSLQRFKAKFLEEKSTWSKVIYVYWGVRFFPLLHIENKASFLIETVFLFVETAVTLWPVKSSKFWLFE